MKAVNYCRTLLMLFPIDCTLRTIQNNRSVHPQRKPPSSIFLSIRCAFRASTSHGPSAVTSLYRFNFVFVQEVREKNIGLWPTSINHICLRNAPRRSSSRSLDGLHTPKHSHGQYTSDHYECSHFFPLPSLSFFKIHSSFPSSS